MEGNDKAFLVGLIGAVLIAMQWFNYSSNSQILVNRIYNLEAENKELQIKLTSFREGVLSK